MFLRLIGLCLATTCVLTSSSFAETNSHCPDEEGYFFTNYRDRNPQQGGFVSNESFVEDVGDTVFIGPDAVICGSSHISGKAKIYGNAVVRGAQVSESAQIYNNAVVEKSAIIQGEAKIYGEALISGSVQVDKKAIVAGNAKISNESEDNLVKITDNARVTGDATVTENAVISGDARVQGRAMISGDAIVTGNAMITGCTRLTSGEVNTGTMNEQNNCDVVLTGSNFPESKHPYANNYNASVVYRLPGYVNLRVTFDDRTCVEAGNDVIVVNETEYTDCDLAGQVIEVVGDTLTITLKSDHSNTAWGYKVADVKGRTQDEIDSERRAREEEERRRLERERAELEAKRKKALQLLKQVGAILKEYFSEMRHEIKANEDITVEAMFQFIPQTPSGACFMKQGYAVNHKYHNNSGDAARLFYWEHRADLDFRNIASINWGSFQTPFANYDSKLVNVPYIPSIVLHLKKTTPVKFTATSRGRVVDETTFYTTSLHFPSGGGRRAEFFGKFYEYVNTLVDLCSDPRL